jgi:hypothetical protein
VLLCGFETGEGTNSNLRLELNQCLRNTKPLYVSHEGLRMGPRICRVLDLGGNCLEVIIPKST